MVSAITKDADDGHLSPLLAWVIKDTVPAFPRNPLPTALVCSEECVFVACERRVEETGAILDSSIQIGPFCMDKKMFFKPDSRKEHGRK